MSFLSKVKLKKQKQLKGLGVKIESSTQTISLAEFINSFNKNAIQETSPKKISGTKITDIYLQNFIYNDVDYDNSKPLTKVQAVYYLKELLKQL